MPCNNGHFLKDMITYMGNIPTFVNKTFFSELPAVGSAHRIISEKNLGYGIFLGSIPMTIVIGFFKCKSQLGINYVLIAMPVDC